MEPARDTDLPKIASAGKLATMPVWIRRCPNNDSCALWNSRHAADMPGKHFHCFHPGCFTRGLLGTSAIFSCARPSAAIRHLQSHHRNEEKEVAELTTIWTHLRNRTWSENRQIKTKNQTEFRASLDAHTDAVEPAGAAAWNTRLHIGKTGPTAKVLLEAIERFGTHPGPGIVRTEAAPHDAHSNLPLPGHTILFNDPDLEDTTEAAWYGVCCSEFYDVDVFGDVGQGCMVRWFEKSHSGKWKGKAAVFYELLEESQPQLLDSMQDWGNLLIYYQEQQLFVLPEDGNAIEEASRQGSRDQASTVREMLETKAPHTAPPQMSKEDVVVMKALFPTHNLHFVDSENRPVNPVSCRPHKTNCEWEAPFRRSFKKMAVNTSNGPVITYSVRYRCHVHGFQVQAGSAACSAMRLSMQFHELGKMRYEVTLLTELQAAYVDTLTISACRRRILDRWLSEALKKLAIVKNSQARLCLRKSKLQESAKRVLMLHDFLPSDHSLSEIMLAMFQQNVAPSMPAYNEAVAAFDGQVIRLDGTFKIATTVLFKKKVMMNGKTKYAYVKVAGAVLVAVGIEGLCLATPQLVPWENSASIAKFIKGMLTNRRHVLGSLSAPAAFTTDNIHQHQRTLWEATELVYPELAAAVATTTMDTQNVPAILMLQDIAHREWVYSRKIAGPKHNKNHADYDEYVATMKDVFNQLRVPHDLPEENLEAYKDRLAGWQASRGLNFGTRRHRISEAALDNHLERALLEPDRASKMDDEVAALTLETVGNATMIAFHHKSLYIPRRVLVRCARRLRFLPCKIAKILPDHGYPDGENFLFHLRGANQFFTILRSRARVQSTASVIGRLVRAKSNRTPTKQRQTKSRTTPSSILVPASSSPPPEDKVDMRGIADNILVKDAIKGCARRKTLDGLLGHKLIRGINTDETAVEAVNKYLNSNTRQGSIGYDVAQMRLCYQRLKWDSAALQRIVFGDVSRSRQTHTKARSVMNLAMTIIGGQGSTWLFQSSKIEKPVHTTMTELLAHGYKFKALQGKWTDEEVRVFFDSVQRYHRTTSVIGNYRSVYSWIAAELKGSRSAHAVRVFAERIYNARKKVHTSTSLVFFVSYTLSHSLSNRCFLSLSLSNLLYCVNTCRKRPRTKQASRRSRVRRCGRNGRSLVDW